MAANVYKDEARACQWAVEGGSGGPRPNSKEQIISGLCNWLGNFINQTRLCGDYLILVLTLEEVFLLGW